MWKRQSKQGGKGRNEWCGEWKEVHPFLRKGGEEIEKC